MPSRTSLLANAAPSLPLPAWRRPASPAPPVVCSLRSLSPPRLLHAPAVALSSSRRPPGPAATPLPPLRRFAGTDRKIRVYTRYRGSVRTPFEPDENSLPACRGHPRHAPRAGRIPLKQRQFRGPSARRRRRHSFPAAARVQLGSSGFSPGSKRPVSELRTRLAPGPGRCRRGPWSFPAASSRRAHKQGYALPHASFRSLRAADCSPSLPHRRQVKPGPGWS